MAVQGKRKKYQTRKRSTLPSNACQCSQNGQYLVSQPYFNAQTMLLILHASFFLSKSNVGARATQ